MNEPEAPFDLSAGALCLDFANTCEDRTSPAAERLARYADIVAFWVQAGVVDRRAAASLLRLAAADPAAARAARDQARQLREAIYRVFSAVAADDAAAAADIARLNRALGDGAGQLRLEPRGGSFVLGWSGLGDTLLAPLRPVAHAAAELLASAERLRVRECGGEHCDWLFLDRSRNRSRRWCSMDTCGNRAKARRHYHRQKRR